MGALIEGRWTSDDDLLRNGAFDRKPTAFRRGIAADGEFPAEPGRYHLYVSRACPWASRTLVVRKLKQLEEVISVTNVHPDILENGWTFGGEPDPLNGFFFLY